MTNEEGVEWEWYREGGKRRFLLRNMIAYTLAIEIPLAVLRLILRITDGGLSGFLRRGLAEAAISLVLITIANWAWLDIKWEKKERAYQQLIGAGTTRKEIGSQGDSPTTSAEELRRPVQSDLILK